MPNYLEAMVDDIIEEFGNLSLTNRQSIKSKVMLLTYGEGDRISIMNAVTALIVEYSTDREPAHFQKPQYQANN